MIEKKEVTRKTLDQFIVDLDQYEKVKEHRVGGNFMGNINSSAIYRNIDSNEQVLIQTHELNKDSQLQFMREITSLASFNYPSIVKFIGYSFVDKEGKPSLNVITEYSPHQNLHDLFAQKRLPDSFTGTNRSIIAFGIISALAYLHGRGMMHRSLSDYCVELRDNYEPMITNFSAARDTQGQKLVNTIVMNDLAFSSPESIQIDIDLDNIIVYTTSMDIFSFGSLLYMLFCKQRPFENQSQFVIINNIKAAKMPELPDDMPEELKELITQCWSFNPEERPEAANIVQLFRSHIGLFPGTDIQLFDKYVNMVLSTVVESPIARLATKELKHAVKDLVEQTIEDKNANIAVLNDIYTIRSTIEKFAPARISLNRVGLNHPIILEIAPFAFVSSLKKQVSILTGIPIECQALELDGRLLTKDEETLEELDLTPTSKFDIHSGFPSVAATTNYTFLKFKIEDMPVSYGWYCPTMKFNVFLEDLHFVTRFPVDSMTVQVGNRVIPHNNLTLEENGIKARDTITVTTNINNDEFEIVLKYYLIKSIKIRVRPLMKIREVRRYVNNMINIDADTPFNLTRDDTQAIMYEHTAFIEHGLKPGSVVVFNPSALGF